MVLLLMKLDQLDQEIENALSATSSMDSTPTPHRRQLLVRYIISCLTSPAINCPLVVNKRHSMPVDSGHHLLMKCALCFTFMKSASLLLITFESRTEIEENAAL